MDWVTLYKALGDENRLRILHTLHSGPFNVQELTQILEATQPNVSHHLKTLQQAGVVVSQKEGRSHFYRLAHQDEAPTVRATTEVFLRSVERDGERADQKALFHNDRVRIHSVLDERRKQGLQFFESIAPEWDEMRDKVLPPIESYLHRIRDTLPPSGTLVELGCGSGTLLESLLPRDGVTIGVDFSEAMLASCQRRLERFSTDLRLGYLEHLPLADSEVDIALAHMVLHHLATPQDALREAHRVLKEDGILVVVDLTRHDRQVMREHHADLWLGFEPATVRQWIADRGFKQIEIELLGDSQDLFLLTAMK